MPRIVNNLRDLQGFHPLKNQSFSSRFIFYAKDKYSCKERISALFRALAKTFITLGLALQRQETLDNFRIGFLGRLIVLVPTQAVPSSVQIYPELGPLLRAMPFHLALRASKALLSETCVGSSHVSDFLLNLFANENTLPLNFLKKYLDTLSPREKMLITPTIKIVQFKNLPGMFESLFEYFSKHLKVDENLPKALIIPTLLVNQAITIIYEWEKKCVTLLNIFKNHSNNKPIKLIEKSVKEYFSKKITFQRFNQSISSGSIGLFQAKMILRLTKQSQCLDYKFKSAFDFQKFLQKHLRQIQEVDRMLSDFPDSKGLSIIDENHWLTEQDLFFKYRELFKEHPFLKW